MKKKIILVGLNENHHNLYSNILRNLSDHFGEITLLTTAKILNNINYKSPDKILGTGRQDVIIKKHINLINAHDILILDEYFGANRRVFNVRFNTQRKIFIIHNPNRWLYKKLIYQPKYLFDNFFANSFFKQFDTFLTVAPNVKEYLKILLNNEKKVFFLPFDSPDEKCPNNTRSYLYNDQIKIVVPGMITERRRNYFNLLEVIDSYLIKNKYSKVKFIFLGRIDVKKDKELYRLIKKLENKYSDKINFWENYINEDDYNNYLMDCDIILSNNKVIANYNDRVELYGLTKEAGVSFLLYKYCKPAIMPNNQLVFNGFDNQIVRYESYSSLFRIFKKIDSQQIDLDLLSENARNNSLEYQKIVNIEVNNLVTYLKK